MGAESLCDPPPGTRFIRGSRLPHCHGAGKGEPLGGNGARRVEPTSSGAEAPMKETPQSALVPSAT